MGEAPSGKVTGRSGDCDLRLSSGSSLDLSRLRFVLSLDRDLDRSLRCGDSDRLRASDRSCDRSSGLSRDLLRVLSLERDRERCRCDGMMVGAGGFMAHHATQSDGAYWEAAGK